jgi:asparaginyl-tRNA synthetase
VAPSSLANYNAEIVKLTSGCSVECRGTLVESAGRGQRYEVQADDIRVVGWVEDPDTYPIQPKQHSFEFLREVAHLRPRTNTFGAIARVRHVTARPSIALYERVTFDHADHHWPDAEGAMRFWEHADLANLPRGRRQHRFQPDFGKQTFLTVSGHQTLRLAAGLSKSNTSAHRFGPRTQHRAPSRRVLDGRT